MSAFCGGGAGSSGGKRRFDHGRACERIPLRHRSNRQRKNKNRPLLACPAAGRGAIHSRVCERIPQSPPNSSCCRSRGGMRGWPVHRPTHAPATALRTNGNSAPHTKPKTPRAVTLWRHACLTTPEHVKQSPKTKTRTPRAAAPAAACVAGRSCGQHMPPQQPSKQTATAPPPQNQKPLVPSLCGGMRV